MYIRYIAPFISSILSLIIFFLPCMSYTVGTDDRHQTISLFTLMKNAWNTVRTYLFSSDTTHTADTDAFSKYVFIFIIVSALMFVIGFLVNTYAMSVSFVAFGDKGNTPENKKYHRLFLSFIPNRGVYIFLGALTLPVFFLPSFLILMYHRFLLITVTVSYSFGPLFIYALILWMIPFIYSFFAKKYERICALSLFPAKKKNIFSEYDDGENDENEEYDEEDNQ